MRIRVTVLGFIVFLALIIGGGFATGELQALYNNTTGVKVSSSETNMFHKSKGFTDGMAQDLSKYKLELAQNKDTVERTAIIDHINEEFANFDEGTIKNTDLRNFLTDCRNGNIK